MSSSGSRFGKLAANVITVVALSALTAGCTYEQANHSDRVTLAAGNAVRANLERETVNPSKGSMYWLRGLGRNGVVIPQDASDDGFDQRMSVRIENPEAAP